MKDITTLLDASDLKALKRGYDPAVMGVSAGGSLKALFPPAAAWVDGLVGDCYDAERMAGKDRERCLIALLSSRDPAMLAVHVYWGLMEELSLTDVGQTLELTGAYQGVPVFTSALLTVTKVCGILEGAVAAGKTGSRDILGAILVGFGVVPPPSGG